MRDCLLIPFVWAALATMACANAPADTESAQWRYVVRDANYDVAIDTARIRRRAVGFLRAWRPTYEVWYRTDHKVPRLHNDKPFSREIVQSIVQCDSLWFKVISVDMSLGDARPISQQRTPPDELFDQPWRRVARGTAEEMAAQAACHFGAKRRR